MPIDYSIKAIPTLYNGILYRSRLEARWAAFFDQLGWEHTYEPYDLDGWAPDFLTRNEVSQPLLVEVKPLESCCEQTVAKIRKGLVSYPGQPEACILTRVAPTNGANIGWLVGPKSCHLINATIGWLAIYEERKLIADVMVEDPKTNKRIRFGQGGGPYKGNTFSSINCPESIKQLWATAANAVQWRGKEAS